MPDALIIANVLALVHITADTGRHADCGCSTFGAGLVTQTSDVEGSASKMVRSMSSTHFEVRHTV